MDELIALLDEMIEAERKKWLLCGQQFVPSLTYDDILQPNDYPELETNPHFRYEEGIVAGLQMAKTVILAQGKV